MKLSSKLTNSFKVGKVIMSIYKQILNPITGENGWLLQDEYYDYHQDVARAAFADMLHDDERNKKYFYALDKTIKKLHQSGKKANVLDIGTGTGLLSMMAVKCGADSVFACEAFMPMANCAEKIIQSNGMKSEINLIKKRSTEIIVGNTEDSDMPTRCNILITEIFDTELIGEGAIGIFNHAHANLLTDDCIVIPNSSKIYAQIAESPLVSSFKSPKILADLDGNVLLKTPKIIENCTGEASVHDIQLSQLKFADYKLLSKPVEIFSFDFNSKVALKCDEISNNKIEIINNGSSQVVFFWWELKMDIDGEVILSCAPYWAHPDFEENSKNKNNEKKPIQNCIPWRDHWIQGVYYLPKNLILHKNKPFYLSAYHDEYSFWFDINNECTDNVLDRPNCTCGFHLAYSRNRIGQINNSLRNKKYLSILENEIDKNSVVVSLSEGSLLGLSTIALGAKKLFCFEPNNISRKAIELYVDYNNLKNVKMINDIDEIEDIEQVTHVVAEPSFTTSILPWDNFYFGIILIKLKERLKQEVKYIPIKANIVVIPVELLDLHKIRAPVKICEGFNMNIFDSLINDSMKKADANIEAQPMWEYPCKALSEQETILSIDFGNFMKPLQNHGSIPIKYSGECNGIVCWIDWYIDNKTNKGIISTGPTSPIQVGEYISWDMFTKQGVHFTPQTKIVNMENVVEWQVNFQPLQGEFLITFNVK
ncbi:protein arginine N-methyltransferase 7 [Condylostylus longicornis]|uniref:protein arginine N-methyltransferase 7 n=1 Tax=Condylostylus longicornis TaxID=2530218 RepID=UPI00244E0111|nr:protein arginine N-methyltransferase 7 [Condylostylus longicornis]